MTNFNLQILSIDETDELFDDAVKVVTEYDRASASLLQRRFSIGYTRAARLIDLLENAGVIGAGEGAKPREVLLKSFEEYTEKEKNGTLVKKKLLSSDDLKEVKVKEPPNPNIFSSSNSSNWQYSIKEILQQEKIAKNSLSFSLGVNERGDLQTANLEETRHLIICGSPFSDKLCFADSFLLSLLATNGYEKLRLLLIDGTHYFDFYSGLPYLLTPVVSDAEKICSALKWLRYELQQRMKKFSQANVRNFKRYNELSGLESLPLLVVVFNRIHDWIDTPEVKETLNYITSLGHTAGISLVLISDRLSANDLPTEIKSNIPNRIVFKTNSKLDSRLAEVKGAEVLGSDEFLWRTKENPNGQKLKAIFSSEQNIKELSNWYLDK
jgi:DNA segregation ATPase FtsK/SpoIIIE-like protein